MQKLILVKHARGAPGLRILGLGPNLLPARGLSKLRDLLNQHTFWANDRNIKSIRKLLAGSSVVISIWRNRKIIGFGRATSDGIYRAVLWDIVVAGELQGQGVGKQVVKALLSHHAIKGVEKIYLMTTNSSNFYEQMGFSTCHNQILLLKASNSQT
ncbi:MULTISPECIES: GNAT family N-acetyltransferase [unclassified Prochlorococcus]|uniref:GNAT family N-acetyltransferase n=1 Tax=unclassified Prochlorococcus TaxID=2627481 RepID=UPI000533B448|nr:MULTISPECIES: GNAT family N-acetyltransferase [unclassified Prochlorococcus]KGG14582.1 putative acetyltransferase [Prochlorococcus sp. MIT 0602]KGG15991.1 putative acetyltransferase [Prochlorococcus sp. MIT 0603]